MRWFLTSIRIVLLVLVSVASPAQNIVSLSISGPAEQLPSEFVEKGVRDANGQQCAGVVILSDLDGLAYNANNGIVKTTREPGRDFLFVSADERVITVLKTGFGPLKLILNELGIKLKPGGVWQVKVTGEKKLELIPISIVTNQAGASIFIDGQNRGTNPTQMCSAGRHEIRVAKPGYKPVTRDVVVSPGSVLFQMPMELVEPVVVNFSSQPAGAKILIDDVEKGETTRGIFLMPGRYKVQLQRSGYLSAEKMIDVVEGKVNNINIVLSKNTSVLHLEITPKDATILINKLDYSGRTDIELAPGSYKLEIAKQNYAGVADIAILELGKITQKSFALVPRTGNLQVSVQPADARVQLLRDGKVAQEWQGLKIIKGLMVGAYTLKVTAAGYTTLVKDVVVDEGMTIPLELPLKKGSESRDVKVVTGDLHPTRLSFDWIFVEGGPRGDFYMTATEVTVDQFYKFCASTGHAKAEAPYGKGRQPVVNVSIEDAVVFCKWVSKESGKNVRLPEEDEWEFAALGGKKARGNEYSGSNEVGEVAWYSDNSEDKTHEVATKKPNELGLYDMSGNVGEWCGTGGVFRGGSWSNGDYECAVSYRNAFVAKDRSNTIGFRLLQTK